MGVRAVFPYLVFPKNSPFLQVCVYFIVKYQSRAIIKANLLSCVMQQTFFFFF